MYQLMKNREYKVGLIENYLLEKGIKRGDLLNRGLKQDLPREVRKRICSLQGKYAK